MFRETRFYLRRPEEGMGSGVWTILKNWSEKEKKHCEIVIQFLSSLVCIHNNQAMEIIYSTDDELRQGVILHCRRKKKQQKHWSQLFFHRKYFRNLQHKIYRLCKNKSQIYNCHVGRKNRKKNFLVGHNFSPSDRSSSVEYNFCGLIFKKLNW